MSIPDSTRLDLVKRNQFGTQLLLLIGGGGHCSEVVDIIRELASDMTIVGVVERVGSTATCANGLPVIGCDDNLAELHLLGVTHAVVTIGAIGTGEKRALLFERALKAGLKPLSLRSIYAVISTSAVVGDGTVIMPGAIINANALIGRNCIINTGAIIEHGVVVDDHCHIGPGATICGGVHVHEKVMIGAGATIIQSVEIGASVVVGAGSVVLEGVPDGIVVAGVPARPIQGHEVC